MARVHERRTLPPPSNDTDLSEPDLLGDIIQAGLGSLTITLCVKDLTAAIEGTRLSDEERRPIWHALLLLERSAQAMARALDAGVLS